MDNKRKRTGKEIKSLNEDIDDLQKKLNAATAKIHRLEEHINSLPPKIHACIRGILSEKQFNEEFLTSTITALVDLVKIHHDIEQSVL